MMMMQVHYFFNRITTLLGMTMLLTCSCQKIADSSVSVDGLTIHDIQIYARNEVNLPPGSKPQASRNIGFVSLLISFENSLEESVSLTLEDIQIRSQNGRSTCIQSHEVHSIELGPLEHAETLIELTNPNGLGNCQAVQAIFTYKIGQQQGVLRSEVFDVAQF